MLIVRSILEFLAIIGILIMAVNNQKLIKWENKILAKVFKINFEEESD